MIHFTDDQASELIHRIYAADGALDADAFVALLSADVTFQMGSAPPIIGREAVHEAVSTLFSSLKVVHHRLIDYWTGRGKLIFQGEVTFILLSSRKVTMPYVDVLIPTEEKLTADGLISDYRIYIDITPLYATTD